MISPKQTKKALEAAKDAFRRARDAESCEEGLAQQAMGEHWYRLGSRGFVENVPRWNDPKRYRDVKNLQHPHWVLDKAHSDAYVAAFDADEAMRRCKGRKGGRP